MSTTIPIRGKCPECGKERSDLRIIRPEHMPQRVMAKCTRCNKNTDFWVIEELPPEDWSAEDSPFAVEKGYGSKAKK